MCARQRWQDLPYFTQLASGEMDRERFLRSQSAFRLAVVGFSQPMAQLAARTTQPEIRRMLLDNAWDEHGRGEQARSHRVTFDVLLERLGGAPDVEEAAVHAFNAALMGTASHASLDTGLAMLGIIEHMFAGISAAIGRGIVDRGWLPEAEVVHYTVHQDLDLQHAEAFFRHTAWPSEDTARGLELGVYLFTRLYRDLSRP